MRTIRCGRLDKDKPEREAGTSLRFPPDPFPVLLLSAGCGQRMHSVRRSPSAAHLFIAHERRFNFPAICNRGRYEFALETEREREREREREKGEGESA